MWTRLSRRTKAECDETLFNGFSVIPEINSIIIRHGERDEHGNLEHIDGVFTMMKLRAAQEAC